MPGRTGVGPERLAAMCSRGRSSHPNVWSSSAKVWSPLVKGVDPVHSARRSSLASDWSRLLELDEPPAWSRAGRDWHVVPEPPIKRSTGRLLVLAAPLLE